MKTLYYNCPAGICGDMNLGAMIDLGVDPGRLITELQKLGIDDWTISFFKDERKGISGTRCDVHCHDHEGHSHGDDSHSHGHHHHHHHPHRTFKDIREMIERSSLDPLIKADAIQIFRVLAEAEGAVHGLSADDVHFHEVGAVDSILDIVGAAICWNLLGIDTIAASTIELGSGTVQCAHGRMPVPAPATAKLVTNFPVTIGGTTKEATTPTGAALLAGKNCRFGDQLEGKALSTGIGIGQRKDPDVANVLYVSLLESATAVGSADEIIELVTNLDDMSPEHVAFLADRLLEADALDVWQTPATFKKGRLGCVLSVLAKTDNQQSLTAILFKHSTTLGIRWRKWNRTTLERSFSETQSELGTVRVKSALNSGEIIRSKIEFDDLSRVAIEHNISLSEATDIIQNKNVRNP